MTSDLTPREREVLALYADGATHRQIAAELCVSVKTVEAHVQHIWRKFGAHSRVEVAVAYQTERLRRDRSALLEARTRAMAQLQQAVVPGEDVTQRASNAWDILSGALENRAEGHDAESE